MKDLVGGLLNSDLKRQLTAHEVLLDNDDSCTK
jgi:hypothetical protein